MATSYNGWPASQNPAEINIVKFGDKYGFPFPGGARGGDVHTVLGYVATQLHKRVEPCISGWCWGYNYRANVNNPSTLSCHSSGTAIDWNAPNHPNGARNTFTSGQVGVIRQILAEVQGAVQWGGDYTGTRDEMHFEIIVNAKTLAPIAASLAGGGTGTGDWFDMATEEDLRRIVGEEIDARLASIGTAVWATDIGTGQSGAAALAASASQDPAAATVLDAQATAVWARDIGNGQSAAANLAQAAANG